MADLPEHIRLAEVFKSMRRRAQQAETTMGEAFNKELSGLFVKHATAPNNKALKSEANILIQRCPSVLWQSQLFRRLHGHHLKTLTERHAAKKAAAAAPNVCECRAEHAQVCADKPECRPSYCKLNHGETV